jgi:CcmD family protein
MSHTFFLVLAYMLLWIVLFGYVWNLLKKQKNLAREVELLKSDVWKNSGD